MASITITIVCCAVNVFAQSDPYSISIFTPANGIASSDVTSLFQDSKGYLWVAHAAGVSRYDGQFENYLFSGNERIGRAYVVAEDQKNRQWIGGEGGLFLFASDKLHHIPFKNKSLPVYHIINDGKGGLWISTSDGPFYFSPADIERSVSSPGKEIPGRLRWV